MRRLCLRRLPECPVCGSDCVSAICLLIEQMCPGSLLCPGRPLETRKSEGSETCPLLSRRSEPTAEVNRPLEYSERSH